MKEANIPWGTFQRAIVDTSCARLVPGDRITECEIDAVRAMYGEVARLTSDVEGLTRIVGAVIQFENCVREFDGDIGCCHAYLDAVWAVMDDANRPELVANARKLAALLGKVPP